MNKQWKPVLRQCIDCYSDEVEAFSENEEEWEADIGDEIRCNCCGKVGFYLCSDDFQIDCWTEWEDD